MNSEQAGARMEGELMHHHDRWILLMIPLLPLLPCCSDLARLTTLLHLLPLYHLMMLHLGLRMAFSFRGLLGSRRHPPSVGDSDTAAASSQAQHHDRSLALLDYSPS